MLDSRCLPTAHGLNVCIALGQTQQAVLVIFVLIFLDKLLLQLPLLVRLVWIAVFFNICSHFEMCSI